MAWLKVDDRFYAHPKLAMIPEPVLPAIGLWTLGLSWSGCYLTDGFVPAGQVVRLGGTLELAAALVEAGLWDRVEGGYRIHDFLDYNPSRAGVEELRAAKSEAGHLGGLASGAARRKTGEADAKQESSTDPAIAKRTHSDDQSGSPQDGDQSAAGDGLATNHEPTPVPVPVPVPEPEPTPPLSKKEETATRVAKSTRPDIEALRQRLGRVSDPQIRILDEILDRHDVTGPNWAANLIRNTGPGQDPLRVVMDADTEWQAARRAETDAAETAWAKVKAEDRETAQRVMQRLESAASGHSGAAT
ncbi:MAG: hypothetical protein ABSC46_03895 [Candidatus Limnocylindrales bacterium]|jgi:hypothetical protein